MAYSVSVPAASAQQFVSNIASVASSPTSFLGALNSALQAVPDYSGPTLSASDLVMAPAVVAPPSPPPAPLSAAASAATSAALTAVANLLSSGSTSGSSAATNALANLTAADLSAAQAGLLSSVAGLDVSSNQAASASLVLGVLNVGSSNSSVTTPPLSVATQTAALSVLSSIATVPMDATSGAVQNVASALTMLASSASATNNMAALTAVAAVQTSMLSSLASQNTSANPAAAAAAVFSVVSAAPGVVLSTASQTAALGVLGSVASGPIDLRGGMADSVAGALSSVVNSAVSSNPAALATVSNVMGNLQTSQASALVSSLGAGTASVSATTSTATIQSLVLVTPPGAPPQALTAPGSPSAFSPMPAGLLPPTTSPVVTQFLSLAFDANSAGAAASNMSVAGTTRLAFTNPDNTPIVVANAQKPILFSLPKVNLVGETQASCAWWDPVALKYSTQGCSGVPNPQPPNHTLAFIPNYMTPNDTSLASAWNISGPLYDTATCGVLVIDCNSNAPCNGTTVGRSCKVYPNPRNPLVFPAVTCPPLGNVSNSSAANATAPLQPVLRVFYGQFCPLWQADNVYNCSWDNIKQSFNGGGCVAIGNTTECMCRHLTDFAAARTPKIKTCSASDMMALQPGAPARRMPFAAQISRARASGAVLLPKR